MSNANPFGVNGWTPNRLGSLVDKTFLITGANAGAGFEATRLLLKQGAKVVMLNRSTEKSEAAIETLKTEFGDHADVCFIKMDLADFSSVREAAATVNTEIDRIDAFICNAAIAQVATQQFTVEGFESQLGTNHYGHFLLTSLLFEQIERSNGRIVVVGSGGHKMGLKGIQFEDMNFDKKYSPHYSYCHSKFAQMMFAYELERRVKSAGKQVSVHVCHPGAARTSLSVEEASWFTSLLFKLLSPLAQSAERGAWPEVLCATESILEPAAYYGPTKRAEMVGIVGKCKLEPSVLDQAQAKSLWELSEKETGTLFELA